MKEKYYKTLITIIVLLIVGINNNVTEYLTGEDYPAPLIMIFYGTVAFILNCIVGPLTKNAILPKQWKFQLYRMVNNGISALLIFVSFKYLSAGSVSLVQRTDIPFVILLCIFIGDRRSSLQFWLSIWTILTILFLIVTAPLIDEKPIGFVYAFLGVTLLSSSYIMVQRTATIETPYTLSIVNSIGMILVGTIAMFINHYSWHIASKDIWIFFLGGIMLFLLYVVAVRLYVWYKPERARFPFILGAIATAIIEMIVEHKVYSIELIALILLISGMIMTISLNATTPRFLHNGYGKIKKGIRNKISLNISQREM